MRTECGLAVDWLRTGCGLAADCPRTERPSGGRDLACACSLALCWMHFAADACAPDLLRSDRVFGRPSRCPLCPFPPGILQVPGALPQRPIHLERPHRHGARPAPAPPCASPAGAPLSAPRIRATYPRHVSAPRVRATQRATCPRHVSAPRIRATYPHHVSAPRIRATCPRHVPAQRAALTSLSPPPPPPLLLLLQFHACTCGP